MQLTHYNSSFKKQNFPITLVCDGIAYAPNIGGLFRCADAFGVEEIIFCGENITLGKRMTKTSRSTENYVKHKLEVNIKALIQNLKSQDYFLIALEIASNSQDLTDYKLQTDRPITLILGNENIGISEFILKQCDAILHIPMFGKNSSMNVVQATSIALYEITKQLNS